MSNIPDSVRLVDALVCIHELADLIAKEGGPTLMQGAVSALRGHGFRKEEKHIQKYLREIEEFFEEVDREEALEHELDAKAPRCTYED